MSCRSWVASCPLFFLCPEKSGSNCGPQSMMNDEFVSHNNSSGGWDMLNKWVSMLKKRGCVADPLKRAGGLFCVLNWKLHCVLDELKSVEFHQGSKNVGHTFLRSYEFAYVEYFLPEFLMFCNKRCLHNWEWIWSFTSACAGMQKMWKDEVQWVERRVCSRNVGVKVENVHPANLLLHSAPAL